MKKPKILVLGATGFVGHTVFFHLNKYYPTYGTTHSPQKNLLSFSVESFESDFKKIIENLGEISLVINCIGVYRNTSPEKIVQTNSLFPHQLEKLSQLYKFNVIHISSDAVFGAQQGIVTETTSPIPDSTYGMSKLLGEINSKRSITIRSSFIGRDKIKKTGLFETVLHSSEVISGYKHQLWSGCTTLQFAKLCLSLVQPSDFNKLRKQSAIFHFAPLLPKTKYEIIKLILKSSGMMKKIQPVKTMPISRALSSNYASCSYFSSYYEMYEEAIKELLKQ